MTIWVKYLPEEIMETDAEALLGEFAEAGGVELEPPIPIEDIVEKHLRLRVEFDDLHEVLGVPREGPDPDILGAIWVDRGEICIDESLDPEQRPRAENRYRFTLAHEGGGHWRLHRAYLVCGPEPAGFSGGSAPQPEVVCRRSQSRERVEWQADFYASCLLMPRAMVVEAWRDGFGDAHPRILRRENRAGIDGMDDPDTRRALEECERHRDDQALEEFARPLAGRFQVSPIARRIRLEQWGLLRREVPRRRRPGGQAVFWVSGVLKVSTKGIKAKRSGAVAALKPSARNPRTHTEKQIRQIAASIEAFVWTNPILVDAEGGVIAGHGRLEAAKRLGIAHVPTICLAEMSAAQKRAYVIADNRLAELAGWDEELLAMELETLTTIGLDFDIEIIGFETAEIDTFIAGLNDAGSEDEADRLPAIDDTAPPITRPGDLWRLGRHRLLCADATRAGTYGRLMDGQTAQMVFTDPPYNVPIDGHVCGRGRVKHAAFAMAAGEMSEAEYTAFLETVLGQMASHSSDGAIHFVCMDWRHLFELLTAGRKVYEELKNVCVWNKTNGGMGSLYRSKHELVAVFKAGGGPHINNVALGAYGRYRTNVWDYAGVNAFGADRDAELAMHPTVKPVALVEDAILDCSRRGGIVLDAFSGSGTTLIAAERSGRRGFGLELDPQYVDATLRRFRDFTGQEPVQAETGRTLAELERESP